MLHNERLSSIMKLLTTLVNSSLVVSFTNRRFCAALRSFSSRSSSSMKVLVGGGTGFIGQHLKRVLEEKGHEVTIISRSSGREKISWIYTITAEIKKWGEVFRHRDNYQKDEISKSGLAECNAVVNLAGENLLNPLKRWTPDLHETVRRSRIDTTRLLATKIAEASSPPNVFVSSSAVGFYPPSDTARYTEETPPSQDDVLSRLCADWENSAELPPSCSTRHVVVRIGVALGRGGGVIQNTIWPFWLGLGGRIGSGRQFFPWIHVDDVAGIVTYAIENSNVTGALNAVAPQIATNQSFTEDYASALHRWAIFPVPSFALNFIFGPERASLLLEGQNVVPDRTMKLGYKFKYPELKAALKDILS